MFSRMPSNFFLRPRLPPCHVARVVNHTCNFARLFASGTPRFSPSKHTVVLDNQTLYIDRDIAKALGWDPQRGSNAGIALSLSGWDPTYFTITPKGSDSDRLARSVVESGHNPNVKQVLDYLKDR
ncbi:hypothetical protein BD410DRAFT_783364 [Rickenella mellea]|uniref:Uncharacterized protein n=1 Tax=Rickenella mellea TaxID=50990 RepID=A0A4Y7QIJ1_9AGAM|nr:hypothetical protein BD410DRAFT_783364 [Rickenella mellea]